MYFLIHLNPGCHCCLYLNFAEEEMFPDSSAPLACCCLIRKLSAHNLCWIQTPLIYSPLLPGDSNHLLAFSSTPQICKHKPCGERTTATGLVHRDTHSRTHSVITVCLSLCLLSASDTGSRRNKGGPHSLLSDCGPTRWTLSGSPPLLS